MVRPDAPAGRRLALVVATSVYRDTSLRELRAPARDAADLGDVLADPLIGGFAVTRVIDRTAQEIRLAVEEFLADRRPDDLLLLYVSCHGLVDLRRRLYFAAADTLKARLGATGVEAQWILDQLDDCRARRQVVVLDCCFSGAFAQRSKGDDDLGLGDRFSGQGRGRVVLTASRASEYSFEGEPVAGSAMPGSVFTSALVSGLRSGAADTDRDGTVSVDDAYAYVFDQVRASAAEQTPQRWFYGAEGSITLARSPAAGQEPAAVPAPNPNPNPTVTPNPAATPAVDSSQRPSEVKVHRSLLGRLGPPWSRRAVYAGSLAAVLAVSALVLGLLLHRGAGASSGWRLVIDGHDTGNGCNVTATNSETGEQITFPPVYGRGVAFQMRGQVGDWSWTKDADLCAVTTEPGPGTTELPVLAQAGAGDTVAFSGAKELTVTVKDFHGEQECRLLLRNQADNKQLDFQSIPTGPIGTSVKLDPLGADLVYIVNPLCGIRISAS